MSVMHVCVNIHCWLSRPNTILVTIMLANNETGVIQVSSEHCVYMPKSYIIALACKGNLICFSCSEEGTETHLSLLPHRFSSGIYALPL